MTIESPSTTTQENGSSFALSKAHAVTSGIRTLPNRVAFNSIQINPSFNIRTMYPDSEIQELADSIREDGQETPLKVRYDEDGKVHLVSGFRRCLAFRLLKWGSKEVEVSFRVDEKKADGILGAFMSNLRENLNRSDVSYHDLSKRYWELDTGMYVDAQGNVVAAPEPAVETSEEASEGASEGEEKKSKSKKSKKSAAAEAAPEGVRLVKTDRKAIAATTGHSISHIGNLVRAWKNLSDDSKKVWQRGFTAAGKRHDLPLDIVFMLAKGDDGEPLNDEKQADVIARYIEAIEKQGGKRTRTNANKRKGGADEDDDGATPLKKAELAECLTKLYEIESEGQLNKTEEAFLKGKIHMTRIALGQIGPQNVARKG